MRIEVSIDIAAPPQAVWRYVRRIERHTEWMHDAAEIHFLSPSTTGVGTRFDTVTRVGPLSTTDRMTITDWDEGRAIGVRHEGAVTGEGRFTIDELEGGRTRFTWTEDLVLPWYFAGRAGEVVARPLLAAVWRRNLRGLRRRVESPCPPPDVEEIAPGGPATGDAPTVDLALLRQLAAAGVAVPAVEEGPGVAPVRIEQPAGPSMRDDLLGHPWRLWRHARTLARLHADVGRVAAPARLARLGPGDRVLHMGLTPAHVILSRRGPVVVGWEKAAAGEPGVDVATTWLLLKTAPLPGAAAGPIVRAVASALRHRFAASFLRAAGRPSPEQVVLAAEHRLRDLLVHGPEHEAVFELARSALARDPGP